MSDLILDCFTYANLASKPNDEAAINIVSETLSLRNELRDRANHPERRAGSINAKAYYDELAKDLVAGVDSGYEKLRKLAGSTE